MQKECKNDVRGTYVHSLLIPHIASWISPTFAIKVSEIVNNFMIKEYRDSIKQKEIIISQKDDKIDNLEKILKNIEKQNKNMEKQNKIANEKLDTVLNDNAKIMNDNIITHKKLDKTVEQLEESDNKLDHITKKLDISVDRRVPKAQSFKVTEDFVIMAENKNKNCRSFYFIRGQKSHIVKKINTYIDENKNVIEFYRIGDIPHEKCYAFSHFAMQSSANKVRLDDQFVLKHKLIIKAAGRRFYKKKYYPKNAIE